MDVILDRGSTPLTSIKKTHLVWVFFMEVRYYRPDWPNSSIYNPVSQSSRLHH